MILGIDVGKWLALLIAIGGVIYCLFYLWSYYNPPIRFKPEEPEQYMFGSSQREFE